MTRRLLAPVLIAATLGVGLTGCMGGGAVEGEETDTSRIELEQQRDDVREAAERAVSAVEDVLPGARSTVAGRYQGCESESVNAFGSMQYRVQVRIEADGSGGPVGEGTPGDVATLPRIGSRLEQDGYTFDASSVGSEGQRVTGTRDGLTISVTSRPRFGDFVLVELAGDCIDIATDDSDYWVRLPGDDTLS